MAIASLLIAKTPPSDPARTVDPQVRHHAVTDLSLRISTTDGEPLAAALRLPNGERTGGSKVLFAAELTLVVGGRLRIEPLRCGGWRSDMALGHTECDGGSFALARKPEAPALSLVVGRMPKSDGDGFHEGFRLDTYRDGSEVVLESAGVPSRGLKVAEIELKGR